MAKKKKPTAKTKPKAKSKSKQAAEPQGAAAKAGAAAVEAGFKHSVSGKKKVNAANTDLPLKSVVVVKGFNPRVSMPDAEIKALASNIKTNGLLQPVVVRPITSAPGTYALVCGERRLTAVKSLGWDTIPVTVRFDLEGDDAKAKAVAVAENSEDLDRPLNYIEIGRACQELAKKHKWSPARIANETGINVGKVRRALSLVKAPDDVQKAVEAGEMSMSTGVELAKMDPDVRKGIASEIDVHTSKADVVRLAKQYAKAKGAKVKPGQKANKAKGKAKAASKFTWSSLREKQGRIAELSFYFVNTPKKEEGSEEWCEIRGALAYALWDRGDLDTPLLPSRLKKDHEDPKADAKTLKTFAAVVAAAAKQFTPEEEEE